MKLNKFVYKSLLLYQLASISLCLLPLVLIEPSSALTFTFEPEKTNLNNTDYYVESLDIKKIPKSHGNMYLQITVDKEWKHIIKDPNNLRDFINYFHPTQRIIVQDKFLFDYIFKVDEFYNNKIEEINSENFPREIGRNYLILKDHPILSVILLTNKNIIKEIKKYFINIMKKIKVFYINIKLLIISKVYNINYYNINYYINIVNKFIIYSILLFQLTYIFIYIFITPIYLLEYSIDLNSYMFPVNNKDILDQQIYEENCLYTNFKCVNIPSKPIEELDHLLKSYDPNKIYEGFVYWYTKNLKPYILDSNNYAYSRSQSELGILSSSLELKNLGLSVTNMYSNSELSLEKLTINDIILPSLCNNSLVETNNSELSRTNLRVNPGDIIYKLPTTSSHLNTSSNLNLLLTPISDDLRSNLEMDYILKGYHNNNNLPINSLQSDLDIIMKDLDDQGNIELIREIEEDDYNQRFISFLTFPLLKTFAKEKNTINRFYNCFSLLKNFITLKNLSLLIFVISIVIFFQIINIENNILLSLNLPFILRIKKLQLYKKTFKYQDWIQEQRKLVDEQIPTLKVQKTLVDEQIPTLKVQKTLEEIENESFICEDIANDKPLSYVSKKYSIFIKKYSIFIKKYEGVIFRSLDDENVNTSLNENVKKIHDNEKDLNLTYNNNKLLPYPKDGISRKKEVELALQNFNSEDKESWHENLVNKYNKFNNAKIELNENLNKSNTDIQITSINSTSSTTSYGNIIEPTLPLLRIKESSNILTDTQTSKKLIEEIENILGDIQSNSIFIFIFFKSNKILKFIYNCKYYKKIINLTKILFERLVKLTKSLFKKFIIFTKLLFEKFIIFIKMLLKYFNSKKMYLIAFLPFNIYCFKLHLLETLLTDLKNDETFNNLINNDIVVNINRSCQQHVKDKIQILNYDQIFDSNLDNKPFNIENFYKDIIEDLNKMLKELYPEYENILQNSQILDSIKNNFSDDLSQDEVSEIHIGNGKEITYKDLNKTATTLDSLIVNVNTEEEYKFCDKNFPHNLEKPQPDIPKDPKSLFLYTKSRIINKFIKPKIIDNLNTNNFIIYFPFFISLVKTINKIRIIIFIFISIVNLFEHFSFYSLNEILLLSNTLIIDMTIEQYELWLNNFTNLLFEDSKIFFDKPLPELPEIDKSLSELHEVDVNKLLSNDKHLPTHD